MAKNETILEKCLFEEIEQLKEQLNKGGFCKLKEKCDKGLCDCTHEEYNNMCEENTKLCVKVYELEERIDKAIEYINNLENVHIGLGENEYNLEKMYASEKNFVKDLLEILKGDSNE